MWEDPTGNLLTRQFSGDVSESEGLASSFYLLRNGLLSVRTTEMFS